MRPGLRRNRSGGGLADLGVDLLFELGVGVGGGVASGGGQSIKPAADNGVATCSSGLRSARMA